MTNETQTQATATQKQYFYITTGNRQSARLKIAEEDVIVNADGEIDCPMDTVLRKNGRSLYDLMSWETQQIQFVLVEDGVEHVLRTLSVDMSL